MTQKYRFEERANIHLKTAEKHLILEEITYTTEEEMGTEPVFHGEETFLCQPNSIDLFNKC